MGTIVRSIIAYLFLLFLLRAAGRRSISQMTPFDLIVLFLLGGVSIQAVIGEDHSMVNAGLAAATIGGLHVAVASLKRWYPKLGEIIDGTPIVVFSNGRWYEDRMARLRLQEQDVMAAARENGLEQLSQIKYAVVERNGRVSIVKNAA